MHFAAPTLIGIGSERGSSGLDSSRCFGSPLVFWWQYRAARAGYLDEKPDELFAPVYERIGALPVAAARDPYVWLRLEELRREPCDQKSISDLALMLDKLGYRRQAADGLYKFVMNCGAPITGLRRSIDIYLKLKDCPRAVEVADEFSMPALISRSQHNSRS